ncbi:cytochrome P450 4B1-like [Simochromis diagramma]|uniref:cytochrome P450 4B1-like n=1 Tax=Simochromis diagramma TaxID=43689 RepID=UPI001A7F0923|nr:cytochrome P450 4B1-like [Simochromis diagramma]
MKSTFYWVSDSPPTGDTTENIALPPALIRKVSSDHLLRFVGEVFLQAEVEDTYTCEMKLAKTFAEFQLGWPHMHYVFAVLCLFVVVYKLTILFAKRREAQRNFQAFWGPPPHWLFGHVLEFKQDGTDMDKVVKWGQEYSYVFPIWFGPFLSIINIQHPDYAKTILTSSEPKDDFVYRFIEGWIGNGLLVSEGQKWFRHRRLLTPGFHYDVLKPYVKLMSESAETMLDKWESYASTNEPFELFKHMSLMTLDSIMKCAFSCYSNCQTEGGTNAYIKAVYDLSFLIDLRLRMFPYHSDLIFHLSPHGFRYRKARQVTLSHTEEVIRKRQEALKEEKELGQIQAKRYLDFLDILLFARDENQQGLSDEDMRAEVDTFMFEGHDTTASGLSFILYCLACNPEHQKICRKEIMEALHDKETMEWEDLSKIPYTTMCIKEALRLYPPVPGISRKITKTVTFCDGRTVPAGSVVGISVYGIHRNASVWENPNVFDPLRFLPENIAKRSPHAFVPFSAGPRNCIGQTFAMNEMKVVTALTLKRYQLIAEPTMKPKIIPRLVLRSLNGIHIKIKPLDAES